MNDGKPQRHVEVMPFRWGVHCYGLLVLRKAADGTFLPSLELVEGVDDADARNKTASLRQARLQEPDCFSVMLLQVLSEARISERPTEVRMAEENKIIRPSFDQTRRINGHE